MRGDRARQSLEIVAALQHRHHAPVGVPACDLHELAGRPAEVGLGEVEIAEGIASMRVEARGDDQKIGRERLEARQDFALHSLAEGLAAIAGPQGRVDDLVVLAALANRAGAGIMGHLMGRGVHHAGIVPEDVLDAIAVMDVEIHDRHALGAVRFLRVPSGDGGIVEEAEAHGRRDFGVMSGRPGRDERVANLAAHHLIDREDRAPRGAKRGLVRARRHQCVRIERGEAVLGRRRPDGLDVIVRMDAGDRGEVGARRGVARQHLKRLALKRPFDRAQAVGPLGMALAHIVREARGVRDDERRSAFHVLASEFRCSESRMSRAPVAESPFAPTPESGLWIKPDLMLNQARFDEPALAAL